MQRKKCLRTLASALIIATAALGLARGAATVASTYKIIHQFEVPKSPYGSLVMDAAGNLYGTTTEGGGSGCGGSGCGFAWKLAPNPDGTWGILSLLHSFQNGADGTDPSAGLIFDAAGNLYGTTQFGGAYGFGGVVFKLAPNPDGTWTETVLHSFGNDGDGFHPIAGLVFDVAGNLYGTTYGGPGSGCAEGCGVVFKLAPNSDGTWTESVLYSFTGGADGGAPEAGLHNYDPP